MLYQDKRSNQRVIACGSRQEDEPFLMVRAEVGDPYYAHVDHLVPVDASTGAILPDDDRGPAAPEEDLPLPAATIPLAETRLNLNTATAEIIAQRVPGLTYRIAKAIKELQVTLPQERFANLDQVRAASSRIDWDAIFSGNSFFLG